MTIGTSRVPGSHGAGHRRRAGKITDHLVIFLYSSIPVYSSPPLRFLFFLYSTCCFLLSAFYFPPFLSYFLYYIISTHRHCCPCVPSHSRATPPGAPVKSCAPSRSFPPNFFYLFSVLTAVIAHPHRGILPKVSFIPVASYPVHPIPPIPLPARFPPALVFHCAPVQTSLLPCGSRVPLLYCLLLLSFPPFPSLHEAIASSQDIVLTAFFHFPLFFPSLRIAVLFFRQFHPPLVHFISHVPTAHFIIDFLVS